MVLEKLVDPNSEDPGALVGGRDEESPSVPDDVEEEYLKGCLVDFLTESVSFKRKIFGRGKRIDCGGPLLIHFRPKQLLK